MCPRRRVAVRCGDGMCRTRPREPEGNQPLSTLCSRWFPVPGLADIHMVMPQLVQDAHG